MITSLSNRMQLSIAGFFTSRINVDIYVYIFLGFLPRFSIRSLSSNDKYFFVKIVFFYNYHKIEYMVNLIMELVMDLDPGL